MAKGSRGGGQGEVHGPEKPPSRQRQDVCVGHDCSDRRRRRQYCARPKAARGGVRQWRDVGTAATWQAAARRGGSCGSGVFGGGEEGAHETRPVCDVGVVPEDAENACERCARRPELGRRFHRVRPHLFERLHPGHPVLELVVWRLSEARNGPALHGVQLHREEPA